MSMHSLGTGCGTIALAVLTMVGPACARAQVAVSLVGVDAHHRLLSEPLVGAGISARFRPDRRLSTRLRVEHTRGGANRTGRPCTGLIALATCPLETMHDKSRMSIATLGVAGRVLGNRERSVAITADLSAGHVRVVSRGTSSGRSLTSSGGIVGVSIGALGNWRIPSVPLALHLTGEIGAIGSPPSGDYIDFSPPFSGDYGVRRLMMGVSWAR